MMGNFMGTNKKIPEEKFNPIQAGGVQVFPCCAETVCRRLMKLNLVYRTSFEIG